MAAIQPSDGDQRGHRLLGMTVLNQGPVGAVNLEFREGVTALYGKNGAGKSRIIGHLDSLVRGIGHSPSNRRVDQCLHVKVLDEVGALGWAIHGAIQERVRYDAALIPEDEAYEREALLYIQRELAYAASIAQDEEAYELPLGLLTVQFLNAYGFVPAPEDGDLLEGLAVAIAEDAYFALVPDSSEGPGGWQPWISTRTTHPHLDFLNQSAKSICESSNDAETSQRIIDALQAAGNSWAHLLGAFVSWRLRNPDAPPWVPVPIVPIDRLIMPQLAIDAVGNDPRNLNEASLRSVKSSGARLISAVDEGDFVISDTVTQRVTALETRANELISDLLVDAPTLQCVIHHPEQWAERQPVEWQAQDLGSGVWVPIDEVSTAQREWASLAIAWALHENGDHAEDTMTILDEPERALHVAAVDQMLTGLKHLALFTRSPVVIATHAPAVLNDLGVHLVHVHRSSDGLTVATPLDDPLGVDLDELGITQAELLQIYRVILLVEGDHDRAVLQEYVGDQLRRSRTLIMPMRGAKSLKAGDAHLLMEYTSASVVALLDNARTAALQRSWASAVEELTSKGLSAAKLRLRSELPRDDTPEERALFEFMTRALERGEESRVNIVGLPVPDVADVLPVEEFVPSALSWGELRHEWATSRTREPFKQWLKATHGAAITTNSIRKAAANDRVANGVPTAIQDVAQVCEVASALSWMRRAG